jgi:hypothetical protein
MGQIAAGTGEAVSFSGPQLLEVCFVLTVDCA